MTIAVLTGGSSLVCEFKSCVRVVRRGSLIGNVNFISRICSSGTSRRMDLADRSRGDFVVVGAKKGSPDPDTNDSNKRENGSVNWDKAWSDFKPERKKKSFFTIDLEKYVDRKPEHSNYPLSEEVDPLRKSERSALGAWTSASFTYGIVGLLVVLFVYMLIIVGPPPS